MPELLRAYGEILRSDRDTAFGAFVVLASVVTLLFVTLSLGALIQTLAARWRRARDVRRHRVGS